MNYYNPNFYQNYQPQPYGNPMMSQYNQIMQQNGTPQTIYLDERLQGSLLKKVLCHEITHAAMFSYNINLSLEQEELLADLIATYGEEILTITNKIFTKLKRG